MNATTEFDLGPLTWVKGEIDLALQRAEEALAQYETGAAGTPLKFCRTHVHQVHGALSIVGLDGVTQVTESIEALLAALEEASLASDEAGIAVLRQAFSGLRLYLDDLMVGEPTSHCVCCRFIGLWLPGAASPPPTPATCSTPIFPSVHPGGRSPRRFSTRIS